MYDEYAQQKEENNDINVENPDNCLDFQKI